MKSFDLIKFRDELLQSNGWKVSDCYNPYEDKFLRKDAQDAYEGAKWGYEAGQQSRQDEIDELQRKLSLCEALRDNQFEHLLEVKEQRDVSQRNSIELQKRIDEAWSWCEKGCVLKAMEILKGKPE